MTAQSEGRQLASARPRACAVRSMLALGAVAWFGCGSSPASDPTGAGGAGTSGTSGSAGLSPGGSSGGTTVSGGTTSGGATSGGTTSGGTTSGGTTSGGTGGDGAAGCARDGDGKTTIVFVNRCDRALSYAGSDISGGALAPVASGCVDVGTATEALPAKRYWGFTGADPGAERHTLAEFTFNTDFNDFDWYNISHVDAHNLPMQIVPLERPSCDALTCADDLLPGCPEVGLYRDASSQGVACVSPERDDASSAVALYFESCDDAYAWSGDDQNGSDPSPVRACAGEDWEIVFCPRAAP